MTDDTKDTGGKSRIQVEDLPREEQELSAEEQKSVQGGATRAVPPGIRTQSSGLVGDGSVKDPGFTGGVFVGSSISDGTSNATLPLEQNKE